MRHSLSAVRESTRQGRCSVCGPVRVLPRGDGTFRCSVAHKQTMEKAHAANPDKYRESSRTRTERYRDQNREACLARTRQWNNVNAERKAELYAAWYADNRNRVYDNNAKRRALEMEAFVEFVDRQIVYERDEGICGICGKHVDHDKFEVDHIVALTKGGLHCYENVQVSHSRCNRRKYNNAKITLP